MDRITDICDAVFFVICSEFAPKLSVIGRILEAENEYRKANARYGAERQAAVK